MGSTPTFGICSFKGNMMKDFYEKLKAKYKDITQTYSHSSYKNKVLIVLFEREVFLAGPKAMQTILDLIKFAKECNAAGILATSKVLHQNDHIYIYIGRNAGSTSVNNMAFFDKFFTTFLIKNMSALKGAKNS